MNNAYLLQLLYPPSGVTLGPESLAGSQDYAPVAHSGKLLSESLAISCSPSPALLPYPFIGISWDYFANELFSLKLCFRICFWRGSKLRKMAQLLKIEFCSRIHLEFHLVSPLFIQLIFVVLLRDQALSPVVKSCTLTFCGRPVDGYLAENLASQAELAATG